MRKLFMLLFFAISLLTYAQSQADTTKEIDLGLSVVWSGWYLNDENNPLKADEYVWASPNKGNRYTGYNEYLPTDIPINVSIAGTNYDPATASWGTGWRLPTKAECEELTSLRPEFTTLEDGRRGFNVTGPNGNELFFEALNGMSSEIGYYTTFWTSDACLESDTDNPQAWACRISIGRKIELMASKREKTLMGVRPVKSTGIPTAVTNIILSEQDITLPITREVILFAFAMPENASVRWLDFSSSDPSIATVDKYGKIKAINAGTATITVSATDGSDIQATCIVTVPNSDETCTVDMGVSMLWASHNVGADNEKETGTYFQFANPSMELTKWAASSSPYVSTMNVPVHNVAGTEYDPATVNMGAEWMTPTKEQFEELFANCDRLDTSDGIELTSKTTGNKLFLPFTGYMNVSALNAKSYGYYQTAVANSTHIISGDYPCTYIRSGMTFDFTVLKINQGVVVRAVTPNPNSAVGNITNEEHDEFFDVYNAFGGKVASNMLRNDMKTLPHGLYIIHGNRGSVEKVKL